MTMIIIILPCWVFVSSCNHTGSFIYPFGCGLLISVESMIHLKKLAHAKEDGVRVGVYQRARELYQIRREKKKVWEKNRLIFTSLHSINWINCESVRECARKLIKSENSRW